MINSYMSKNITNRFQSELVKFPFGAGSEPAHRHPNGGGWVADSASVAFTVYVAPYACVYENAIVEGSVRIEDRGQVFGNARLFGKAIVKDNAKVYANAVIFGRAVIDSCSEVYDNAEIFGNAVITGSGSNQPEVTSGAVMFGQSIINLNTDGCTANTNMTSASANPTWPLQGNDSLVDSTESSCVLSARSETTGISHIASLNARDNVTDPLPPKTCTNA